MGEPQKFETVVPATGDLVIPSEAVVANDRLRLLDGSASVGSTTDHAQAQHQHTGQQ